MNNPEPSQTSKCPTCIEADSFPPIIRDALRSQCPTCGGTGQPVSTPELTPAGGLPVTAPEPAPFGGCGEQKQEAEPLLERLTRIARTGAGGVQEQALGRVVLERREQFDKWGEQNHELPIWLAILHEETGELSEAVLHDIFGGRPERNNVFKEAVQVAAVALQIVEFLLRWKVGDKIPATEREASET